MSPARSAISSSFGSDEPLTSKVAVAFCVFLFAFTAGLTYNAWNISEAARIGAAVSAIALLGIFGVVRYSRKTWLNSESQRLSLATLIASAGFIVFAVLPGVPVPFLGLALIPLVPQSKFRLPTHRSALVIAATVALSALSIAGIFLWWTNRSGVIFVSIIPTWLPQNHASVVMFCLLLATTNAVYEEVLWRYFLFRISKGFAPAAVSVGLLSILFGIAHWAAIPDEVVGVILTSAFSLGSFALIRLARGSLLPSIAAHIVADFSVLLLLTRVI